MFLSKRSNGIYYIYFDNELGSRNKVSTKTRYKNEALHFLSEFKSDIKNPKGKRKNRLDLNSFINSYFKFSVHYHRPKTTKSVTSILREFETFLNNPFLSNISERQARSYIIHKAKVSNYTAQRHLAYLRSAFNYAKKNKLIASNPFSEINNYKLPQKQPKFFTKEELDTLLHIVEEELFRYLIKFAVNTGMRQMELITLQWDQINFTEKLITLNNRNHITKGKTIRSIPINSNALQILKKVESEKKCKYVFSKNGIKLKPDFVSKKFKKYVRKANINPQLNFHSLRHTFASWLVQRGVSIYQVSKLLGHADIKTTEIYAHLRADDLRKSVEMLG